MMGPLKFFGKGIFFLFSLFSKYGWIILTLLIVMSGLIASIQDAREQKDARIVLNFLGTSVVSADEGIYNTVQDLEFEVPKKKGIVEQIGYYADFGWFLIKSLWRNLWMLIFWFIFIFKLERFFMGNKSKDLRAFIIALGTMVVLQISVYGIPFKGIISLAKFIIEVITNV